jgi:4-amino-4-deoxy-L-arabinose transferase-like glycosyltransferase
MFITYFSTSQVISLISIFCIHAASVYFFTFKKNIRAAILLLFIGGIAFRCLMISFDNFFHTWDEQYHALVAKNMAENNFLPMLYKNTPLGYDFHDWSSNYIWLHKQPMFLWQMALAIKLFGATAFAARIPSMIMFSLLILIIYRIGKITLNERVGYISAFLFATNHYLLEFVTGIISTDHNDIAFIFYVTLSIWAYTEYCFSNKQKYVWLIGLFAGFALLNKWLVGLLVFSGWGFFILFFISGVSAKITEVKSLLKAILVALLIFLPWQIYIYLKFPAESSYEFEYNSKHFFEALEHHYGTYWYHFNEAIVQYGFVAAILLPIALIFMFLKMSSLKMRISYIVFVVITYLFFTLSQTKMTAFCMVVSPILFLALGNLLSWLFGFFENRKLSVKSVALLLSVALLTIGITNIDVESMQRKHTAWKTKDSWESFRTQLSEITQVADSIKGKYDKNKTVVLNCPSTQNIPMMFFSDYIAYDRIPTQEEYFKLKRLNYNILYFNPYSAVPDYIKNDSAVVFVIRPSQKAKKKSRIRLLAFNNKYVCDDAFKNNFLFANREKPDLWETFEIIEFEKNNECAIRSWDNHFISADMEKNGELIANRETLGSWETFTIIHLDANRVAFKAGNEKYLTCNSLYQLSANSKAIGEKETFKLIPFDN